MSVFGFELLIQQVTAEAEARAANMAASWRDRVAAGDSPIERLFHLALYSRVLFEEQMIFNEVRYAGSEAGQLASAKKWAGWDTAIILQRQVMFNSWRVDFMLHVYDFNSLDDLDDPSQASWRRLIVECDGHDFHERTKEQAAKDRSRDREAQLAGVEVFRFTGSEIWRDPWGCAGQVLEWVNRGNE